VIRRAEPHDRDEVGRVFVSARDRMTYLPRIPDEDRPRLGGWIVERHEVWVAEEDARVVGFVGLGTGWLDHIYVEPEAQGRGLGTALLDHAKRERPEGLQLWVFQKNEGARRLYERHGFRVVELTDGAGNMEREPDARYEWHPGGEAAGR
jgi:ribosomal protein S18 acetylase RimI-like enzyme